MRSQAVDNARLLHTDRIVMRIDRYAGQRNHRASLRTAVGSSRRSRRSANSAPFTYRQRRAGLNESANLGQTGAGLNEREDDREPRADL